jgi:hypothetical protein
MSSAAMLFALCALVTGSVSAKTGKGGQFGTPAPNSVGPKQLKTNAVTPVDIAPKAVDAAKLKEEAVTAAALAKESVLAAKLANDAVTKEKVAPEAIDTEAISDSLPAVGVQSEFTSPIDEAEGYEMPFAYEIYDTASMHDDTPDTDVVVPTDGVYLFTGTTYWSSSSATSGFHAISLIVNGSSKYASEALYDETSAPWSVALVLDAGDVVQLRVINQALGTNPGDGDTSHTSSMNMIWIAPGPA